MASDHTRLPNDLDPECDRANGVTGNVFLDRVDARAIYHDCVATAPKKWTVTEGILIIGSCCFVSHVFDNGVVDRFGGSSGIPDQIDSPIRCQNSSVHVQKAVKTGYSRLIHP